MIDIKEFFNNSDVTKYVSLWLPDNSDGVDLIGAAEYAVDMNVPGLSVMPLDVRVIWPWVERLKMKLISRFYVNGIGNDTLSNLAINVKSVFRQGADGAQIIVKLSDLDRFANSLLSVRDDLFFNKDLSIGIDIFKIWPLDWANVFDVLKKLNASSLLLIMTHDDMDKSDFTGRIYAALTEWNANPNMELHVMLGDSYNRAEQVYRLVSALRPELLDKLQFFVNY